MSAICAACLLWLSASAIAVRAEGADALSAGRVVSVSDQRPVCAVDIGGLEGISENDRVVFLSNGNAPTIGRVIHLEAKSCGVRFDAADARKPEVGDRALVIRAASKPAPSTTCALSISRTTTVDRVFPAGDRVWMRGGRSDGWSEGDSVLVVRPGSVIGWGKVTRCYEQNALVLLDRTREDGLLARRGDRVEQIGRMGAGEPVRTRVAAITQGGMSPRLVLAGDERSGFSVDDRIEIYRDGTYQSYAKIVGVSPVVQAEVTTAFQRSMPVEGDAVVLRPEPDSTRPAVGRIFRVESDYVLVTLGQVDEIEKAQTLFVLNPDGTTDALKVRSTYPEHCGARLVKGAQLVNSNGVRSEILELWAPVTTFAGAAAVARVSASQPLQEEADLPAPWLAWFAPEGYCLAKVGEVVATDPDGSAWMVIAIHGQQMLAARMEPPTP